MSLYVYVEQLFDLLNTRDHQVIILAVYVGGLLLALLLRGAVCLYYRSVLLRVKIDAKPLKTAEDVKALRFGLLRRLAADYTHLAARNAARVPTRALTDRQVAGLNLLGWRCVSIMPFAETLESGLLWVGLVLALVFTEYAAVYGVLAVAAFLLTRLAAAFFDFRAARDNLADELHIYTERELGAMFPIPISGTIVPRLEMGDAAEKVYALLAKPLEAWAASLTEAERVQGQVNEAAKKLREAAETLAAPLREHGGALEALAAEQRNLTAHTQLIAQNQRALETAYASYEASLQNLVQTLGDGMGAYFKLHGQSAANAINDTLSAHMEKLLLFSQRPGENR